MRIPSCFLAASIIALSACSSGQDAEENQDVSSGASDTNAGHEEAFIASFRRGYVPSCASTVVSRGMDQAVAERACGCMADALIRDLSVSELMSATEEQLRAAASECVENVEQSDG